MKNTSQRWRIKSVEPPHGAAIDGLGAHQKPGVGLPVSLLIDDMVSVEGDEAAS